MQFPITIGLHRSFFIDFFVFLGAVAATGASLSFPRAAELQLAMLLFVWLIALMAWQHLAPKISLIRLDGSGELSIASHPGDVFRIAKPLPGATVHPWLTVLRLKMENGPTRTLILTADSLRQEDFRRLRVFLRWRVDFSGASDDV